MLHSRFQASEPSGSEEEDFLIYYYVFLNGGHIGPQGHHMSKLVRGALGNATY